MPLGLDQAVLFIHLSTFDLYITCLLFPAVCFSAFRVRYITQMTPPRPHKKGFSGLKITKDAMFSTSLFSLAILLFKIFSTINS